MSGWFHRISQFKPMALPRGVKPPLHDLENNEGIEDIDNVMSDETAEREQQKYPGMSYLGSGACGLAVQFPNQVVCKYTTDKYEANIAALVMKSPKKHIVKVHKVQLLQRDPVLFSIQMEKCKPLSNFEKTVVRAAKKGRLFDRQQFQNLLKHLTSQKYFTPEEVEGYFNEIAKIFYQYCDLIQEIRTLNLDTVETGASNIGFNSTGDLVLFDIGGTSLNMRKTLDPVMSHSHVSWLTRIAQLKPMPFPVRPPANEETDGWEKIDGRMRQDTSDFEYEKFPNQEWVGSGKYGVATECEPGWICKYTVDAIEAHTAIKVMDKYYPGVVHVADVQLVQEEPAIYMIKSEKCKTLTDEQWLIVDMVYTKSSQDIFRQGFTTQGLYPIESIFNDFARELRLERITKEEIIQMYNDYIGLLQTLTGSGFRLIDAHGANIGYNSQNELVLFDLGLSQS